MDRPFAMLPDAEDMIWGSNRGMAMAERSRGIVTPPSPRSADIAWNDSGPRPSSQNGQLSPVSTGMDLQCQHQQQHLLATTPGVPEPEREMI